MRLTVGLPPVATVILEAIARDPDAVEDVADEFKVKIRDTEDPLRDLRPAIAKNLNAALLVAADSAKFERELDEKYGYFKGIILHPKMQRILALLARVWQRTYIFGKRPVPLGGAITLLLFIYRSRRMSNSMMLLVACMLFGINPGAVVLAIALWKAFWAPRSYMPRGFRPLSRPFDPPADSEYHTALREGRAANRLADPFMPAKAFGGGGNSCGDSREEDGSASAHAEAAAEKEGLRRRNKTAAPAVTGADSGVANGSSSRGGGTSSGKGSVAIYDHIIIGSDMGGLYAAALLSCCGHRCLVLEKGALVGGDVVIEFPYPKGGAGNSSATGDESGRGVEWSFATRNPVIGRPRIAELIAAVCHPSVEAPQWNFVGGFGGAGEEGVGEGLEEDGRGEDYGDDPAAAGADGGASAAKVYRLVEPGEQPVLAFPAGLRQLCAATAPAAPEQRLTYASIVAQVEDASKDAASFYLLRALPARTAAFLTGYLSMRPMASATLTCAEVFQGIQDPGVLTLLSTFFSGENIAFQSLSFGAYVLQTAPRLGGQYETQYGWRGLATSLLATIEAAGGRVLTSAPVKQLLVEEGRAVGVLMDREAGSVAIRVRPGGSVISALGAVETYETLVPHQAFDAMGGWPEGMERLQEARPRVHLCIGLRGNWCTDLDAPQCDFEHVRDPSACHAEDHDNGPNSEWYRISFTEARIRERWTSPRTCCVVTAELGDEHVKRVPARGGSGGGSSSGSGSGSSGGAVAADASSSSGGGSPMLWSVLHGKSRERLKERLLRRLRERFPTTEGRDEFVALVEAPRPGLSHTPARFAAKGLRSPTPLPGLFLASQDLTVESFEGQVQAGWMAAHAVLGYDAWDFVLRRRTLVADLATAAARSKRRWWRFW